ncbi:TetR family transcriptional regulator [Brevundimonas intermedia]|uniref:TetR family transcriptional regulator n=2 Tax=Brevundimonas intermedia TaxID=74315 RepID=A0ABQ5TDS0_9CAUL|nr:TetR family transcriptional regulator [Brevundimonas intermedia]
MEIVNRDGPDALSMRALADALESGTATLYRHVSGRPALEALLVDAVFAQLDLADDGDEWRSRTAGLARGMYEALRRHPGVAPLMLRSTPNGPNAMKHRERCIALLQAEGFAAGEAAVIYATLAHYVLGSTLQLIRHDDRSAQAFEAVDPAAYPATRAAAATGRLPVAPEDEFSYGLELMLDGLEGRRPTAPSAVTAP